MPQSLLLCRLSFTFMSAVEAVTNLLLSCEPHAPYSPRLSRQSRSRSLPIPPISPTSITTHVTSPISLLDVEHHHSPPLFDDKSTTRRKRSSRSQNPSVAASNRSRRTSNTSTTHKLSRHPSRLLRRSTFPKNLDTKVQSRQRQHNSRTTVRRTRQLIQSSNQRLAFVQPPSNKLPGLSWRRYRHTVDTVELRSQKRIRPEPPVAPIALHSTIRQVPRGTLTSFLTTDDTTLSLGLSKRVDSVTSNDKLLEQGIRPSRRVRFAQNVQLVC